MGIITITSDWGHTDFYQASVKGMIYKYLPHATIVDISHSITPFDIVEASFIIKNAYKSFPEGSVHIIGIGTEETMTHVHSAIYYDNHYFVGNDNGIFSLIFDHKPEKMVELDILHDSSVNTFSSRDRFVKAAAHLAEGKPIEELGDEKTELETKIPFEPSSDNNGIKGIVTYIDNFENLFTNISFEFFNKMVNGKKFTIGFNSYTVDKISSSYADVRPGEIVAIFASNGMLEIAINKGNAASLLGMKKMSHVYISFEEK
ncbi:MAG: hypothetical protein C0598_10755 [Marinilabiliales bacterium]|nr:MAG: hypothetical protein C0598_10755 [Marinilabiliales bacterium]